MGKPSKKFAGFILLYSGFGQIVQKKDFAKCNSDKASAKLCNRLK